MDRDRVPLGNEMGLQTGLSHRGSEINRHALHMTFEMTANLVA